jgi:hypothetical protein
MTRDEAVKAILVTGSRVVDRLRRHQPQWLCDRLEIESAEDGVDHLIALGLLEVEQPTPADVGGSRE